MSCIYAVDSVSIIFISVVHDSMKALDLTCSLLSLCFRLEARCVYRRRNPTAFLEYRQVHIHRLYVLTKFMVFKPVSNNNTQYQAMPSAYINQSLQ